MCSESSAGTGNSSNAGGLVKEKTPACPVCESVSCTPVETIDLLSEFAIYADGDDEIRGKLLEASALDFDNYRIFKCGRCGLEFAQPMQAPAGAWYAYAYNKLGLHAPGRWEFSFVADRVNPGDYVGEIGCGRGVFLSMCRDKGAGVYGIDFSDSSVEYCRSIGLDVELVSAMSEVPESSRKMDVIASFHVIEHLEDPSAMFRIANSWAGDGGSLWIAVPSDRRMSRLRGDRELLDNPPHHLTRWTRKSLGEVGRRNGWMLEDIFYEKVALKHKLYDICTRNSLYKAATGYLDIRSAWSDRLLRYIFYIFYMPFRIRTIIRLTGHSVLVKYSRIKC